MNNNHNLPRRLAQRLLMSLLILPIILGIPFPSLPKSLAADPGAPGWVLRLPAIFMSSAQAGTGITYYVDCIGKDTNNGTSTSTPWKSLSKANNAKLSPGDKILFKRGCTWSGTLKASWTGTSAAPITVGAYGSGNLPKFQNGPNDLADKFHNTVNITGSYLVVEYLEATIVNPPVDPGCNNQPVGFYAGFNFGNPDNTPNGGSYNTLRYSKVTNHTAGVHFANVVHDNHVINNTVTNNGVMNVLTPTSVKQGDDLGAWGILLKGKNNEVAYNYLANNVGICAYDTQPQGNAVELYEAQNNSIHHNTSVDDQTFSELGGSAAIATINNRFSYNLVISSRTYARFVVARGSGSQYGPNNDTKVWNNTVYYTGAQSQALVCGAGCNPTILTAQNNIFWAEEKAAYADAAFTESNNLYWSSNGSPMVQFQGFNMSGSSKIAAPQFVNTGAQNFHLQSASPAVNSGVTLDWLKKDLDGTALPQGGTYDLGAYEYK